MPNLHKSLHGKQCSPRTTVLSGELHIHGIRRPITSGAKKAQTGSIWLRHVFLALLVEAMSMPAGSRSFLILFSVIAPTRAVPQAPRELQSLQAAPTTFTYNSTRTGDPRIEPATLRCVLSVHGLHCAGGLGNPWIGLVPFAGPVATPVFPHSMENFYVSFASLMRDWNSFTLSNLEARLSQIGARGHQAICRVYLDYPDRTLSPYDGVPAFLVEGLTFYHSAHGVTPDWSNTTLIDAVVQLVEHLGTLCTHAVAEPCRRAAVPR